MQKTQYLWGLLVALGVSILPATGTEENHAHLQSVNDAGTSAWDGTLPFKLTGVMLNNPEDMLDPTPDFIPWNDGAGLFQLGAQWQFTFQAVATNDGGGTTVWMGQNYGNLPWLHDSDLSYGNEAWTNEMNRVSFDAATGHRFRAGDLVQVTARRSLFYGGQQNINEAHDIDPAANFDITLISSNYGLPAPQVITLADVMRPDDGTAAHYDFFDPARATGGEHYQGMRVRINDLTLVTTNGWNPAASWAGRYCTATDGQGRFFPLIVPRYSLGPAPTSAFDAIGVFLQESGSANDGTFGYELFVQQIIVAAPPVLTLRPDGVLAWPTNAAGFQLESTTNLAGGTWAAITNRPDIVGDQNTQFVLPAGAQRFFRLRKTN